MFGTSKFNTRFVILSDSEGSSNPEKQCEQSLLEDSSQAVYEVKIVNHELLMSNIMNGNIALTPKTRDRFAATQWYADKIVFERDGSGKVISFRVSSGRMKNVRFKRMGTPYAG